MGRTGRVTMVLGTATLAVAMLLILVSGCSSLAGHSVTGTWKLDNSQGATTAINIMTFRADGTGLYKSDITTPGNSYMDMHANCPFTWQMTDHGGEWQEILVIPDRSLCFASRTMSYYPHRDVLSLGNWIRVS